MRLSQDTARLSDAVERLTAQLSDLVSDTSLPNDQNQQTTSHALNTTTTTIQHYQQLAAQLSNIQNQLMKQRRVLMPLPVLSGEADKENWKAMLELALARDELYRYVEDVVPQPEDEAERQRWKTDCQDIVELMIASIQDRGLLERIRCLGWSPTHSGPKATYRTILDSLGNQYDGEMELVWSFKELQTDENQPIDKHPEDFFYTLERLYRKAKRRHRHIHFHPVSLSYFLEGIRGHFPRVYDRHAAKVDDGSFTWNSFFRDITQDAMLHRFDRYPAYFQELEIEGVCDADHEKHKVTLGDLNVPLFAMRLSPKAGRAFLGGLGFFEFWQLVILQAAHGVELQMHE